MKSIFLISLSVVALTFNACAGNQGEMQKNDSNYVRPAAVAGSFYPGSAVEIAKMLAGFFHDAPRPQLPARPIAIVAPHAGYVYSGAIAARAYKALQGEEYKTVIVISPSHMAYFPGVSAFDGKAYSTPLGEILVDKDLTAKIAAASPLVRPSMDGHAKGAARSEHALEVQLPFLQTVLGNFSLVALMMGDQDSTTCRELGKAISRAIGDRSDILIVASSDLSHFHDGATASRLDSVVARDIEKLDFRALSDDLELHKTEACGGGPIIAAMTAAADLGSDKAMITGRGDSGDITGDKSSVVGYLSAVIYPASAIKAYEIKEDSAKSEAPKDSSARTDGSAADFNLAPDDQTMLLCIARQSIESKFGADKISLPSKMPASICQPLGAFVTLRKYGELRGCIGTFQAKSPLYQVVTEMAQEAAFSDYRFERVTPEEFKSITIEISVLTPMKRIYDPDSVVVGRDGLYIRRGGYSGVLLPQVPVEQAWDRNTFLDHTCLKAGLPIGTWRDSKTELYVFQAQIFSER